MKPAIRGRGAAEGATGVVLQTEARTWPVLGARGAGTCRLPGELGAGICWLLECLVQLGVKPGTLVLLMNLEITP